MTEPTEQDFQRCDEYLDLELDPADRVAFERRLSSDASLAALLERLRSARALRLRAMDAGGFDPHAIDRLVASVRRADAGERLGLGRSRVRYYTSLAATLLLGVGLGITLGGGVAGTRQARTGTINTAGIAGIPVGEALSPGGGAIRTGNQTLTSVHAPGLPARSFTVVVHDDRTRAVRVERFDTLDEARAFAQAIETERRADPGARVTIHVLRN